MPTRPSRQPPLAKIDTGRALRKLRRCSRLGPLIRRHPPPAYSKRGTAFAALGRAILYQQLTGKAAATILRRFTEPFPGGRFPRPQEVLALEESDFTRAGVSRQKRTYLIDLAAHFADGRLSPHRFRHQSDDDLLGDLTRVKGIGIWTVHMFQISTLQRPDILPVGDLGIQKGIEKLFRLEQLPNPSMMEELAEHWRPWRSVACHYLWRHVDFD